MTIFTANPYAQYLRFKDEIDIAIARVLESQKYILSDEVSALEKEFASYLDCKHSIGVASGTDAIELVLRALNIGIDDEVVTVSHTAIATVSAIQSVSATPILCDIDSNSFTLDTSNLCDFITSKTKAIIAVHLYGRAADMNFLEIFCKERNIYLIEDCSQAHGLILNNGCSAGTVGIAGCFSCYPTKNLGGYGDGGLISTNSDYLYEKLRSIRQYGWDDQFNSLHFGRNSRLDEMQAAILRVKLNYLNISNSLRKDKANLYKKRLQGTELILPNTVNEDHVYHLYVIRTQFRDSLRKFLKDNDVYAGIHYPLPIHKQKSFKISRNSFNLANTDYISKQILSLPIYPELTDKDVNYICDIILKFLDLNINK